MDRRFQCSGSQRLKNWQRSAIALDLQDAEDLAVNVRRYHRRPQQSRLLSLALAGLMVVGGAPRVNCDCIDAQCRNACARAGLTLLTASCATAPPRCHCCQNQAQPTLPVGPCDLTTAPDCCDLAIHLGDLSSPGKSSPFGLVAESAPAPLLGNLHDVAPPYPVLAAPRRLPPDDPVSRAQILRI